MTLPFVDCVTRRVRWTRPASGANPGGASGVVDQERLDRLDQLADKATAQYGGQETKTEPEPEPKVTRELVNQPKDPKTGKWMDDTAPLINAIPALSAADKKKIFESNARKVFNLKV